MPSLMYGIPLKMQEEFYWNKQAQQQLQWLNTSSENFFFVVSNDIGMEKKQLKLLKMDWV